MRGREHDRQCSGVVREQNVGHATQSQLTGHPGTRKLDDSLETRRSEAIRQLRLYAVPDAAEQALWRKLDNVYFQRHSADEIAWHARQLYFRVEGKEPLVKARLSRAGVGLQVMIYLPDQKQLFARICSFSPALRRRPCFACTTVIGSAASLATTITD